jgi:hypothetical protein
VLPANGTLTNGVGTFQVTFDNAGPQTVTATDTVTSSIDGTSGTVADSAGPATHLTVSAPSSATSGSAASVTVAAFDAYGNTATGYAGTVHFTSSDGAAVLPADSTLTSGTGTFSATLETAGTQTVTATDTVSSSIAGTSGNVSVGPGPATHLTVSAPSSDMAGSAVTVTVTALDAAGNTATGYTGTVHFGSTGGTAVLPANGTLTNGVGTFQVTFDNAGPQTVTATDTVITSIKGVSGSVTVSPAPTPTPTLPPITTPTPAVAPSIVTQPAPETVNTGANAVFWATATGTPLNFQWYFNGTAISGAANPLLMETNVQASNAGSYTVTVSNTAGTVSSIPVTLAVNTSSTGNPSTFSSQPSSQTITGGSTVVFTAFAGATGGTTTATKNAASVTSNRTATTRTDATVTYQWFWNGNAILGANDSTYVIYNATSANDGSYTCLATDSSGAVLSSAATLNVVSSTSPGRLINISCRADVGTGASQLIVGFVVGGQDTSGTEPLLVRASGPALAPFGVTGVLADPQLQLNSSTGVLATDSGWAGNAQVASTATSMGAFAWTSTSSHDSALLESLPGGAYTAQVTGASGDTGVALAEVYDATPTDTYTPSSPRLINISARAQVGTGGNILIAGFVIGGTTSKTVLIRGSGPALAAFGLSGTLPDPQMQLFQTNADGTSALVQADTGWGGDTQIAAAAANVGAFSWGTSATPDSAILITLPPGAYTVLVSGASGDTGLALVEVYDVQ